MTSIIEKAVSSTLTCYSVLIIWCVSDVLLRIYWVDMIKQTLVITCVKLISKYMDILQSNLQVLTSKKLTMPFNSKTHITTHLSGT